MGWLIAITLVALVGWLVWGSASIDSGLYLKALCRKRSDERRVAITFDDGPDPLMTPRLLELLHRYGAKATFFVVGTKAAEHPDLVRRIVAEGHTLGNHTSHHRGLDPLRSTAAIAADLAYAREQVEALTGRRMKLFRPPFGVTNPMLGRAVRGLGLMTIGWSVRSFDTVVSTPREKVLARITRRLQPGAVILLHDRLPEADRLLEMLLQKLENENYTAVTVDSLFEIEAYEN